MKNLSKILMGLSTLVLLTPMSVHADDKKSSYSNDSSKNYTRSYSRPSNDFKFQSQSRNISFGDSQARQDSRYARISSSDSSKLEKATKALHAKNYKKADLILGRLIERHNKLNRQPNLLAYMTYNRAVAQYGLNNDAKAIKYFKQVAGHNQFPLAATNEAGVYEAYTALGVVYGSSGRLEDVKDTLEILRSKSKACLDTCEAKPRIDAAVEKLEDFLSQEH